jgi:F-type H+-transporting ATPase subunit g
MYWGRVTKELGKEVYTKENLAPPKLTQWDSARKEFWQLFVWRNVREWKMNDVAKGAVVGVELLGLFTIGEVVGRRSLIGYNV